MLQVRLSLILPYHLKAIIVGSQASNQLQFLSLNKLNLWLGALTLLGLPRGALHFLRLCSSAFFSVIWKKYYFRGLGFSYYANTMFPLPIFRLLCAIEGKYLVQETCYELTEGTDTLIEHHELHCLSFPCSIPNISGRGFIEVFFLPILYLQVLISWFF